MEKNVICIKWGTKFGADYVNRLYKMVEKNLSIPHRFVCFTDNAEGLIEGIEVRRSEYELPLNGLLVNTVIDVCQVH